MKTNNYEKNICTTFIDFFKKRKENKVEDTRFIGIELKKLRCKLNLTLKDVCEGICCQSYLSKMEHNLAGLKPSFVAELFSKLGSKGVNNINPLLYQRIVDALVKAYLYNDDRIIDAIDKYTQGHEMAYYLDLVHLIIGVKRDEKNLCIESINNILYYLDNLNEVEIVHASIFVSIFVYNLGKYSECRKILEFIMQFELGYVEEMLVKRYKFYTDFYTNNIYLLNDEFNELTNLYYKYGLIDKMVKLKKDYILMSSITQKKNFAYTMYKDFALGKSFSLDAYFEYISGNYNKAYKILSVNNEHDYMHYYTLALVYDKTKNKKECMDFFNRIAKEKIEAPDDILDTLDYLKIKYNNLDNINNIKLYLREVLLPKYENSGYYFMYEYFCNELICNFIDEAHYKEAILYFNKKSNVSR